MMNFLKVCIMKNPIMKQLFFSTLCLAVIFFLTAAQTGATVIHGGIDTSEHAQNLCKVTDKNNGAPVPYARITVPAKNFTTYSDSKGQFALPNNITNAAILSATKENYKPFSITINKNTGILSIQLEKSKPFDIKLESDLCHLGDNNFSGMSANACQFKGRAIGPVYNKTFVISQCQQNQQPYLVIGSIIGIDTALARGIGQNSITTSYASPPCVYLNGQKICEIQINGDNQRIYLPKGLIKFNQKNTITIKAGRNLMQKAYVDYDDIEFINLSIENFNIKS